MLSHAHSLECGFKEITLHSTRVLSSGFGSIQEGHWLFQFSSMLFNEDPFEFGSLSEWTDIEMALTPDAKTILQGVFRDDIPTS